jgi:hypothetical protein
VSLNTCEFSERWVCDIYTVLGKALVTFHPLFSHVFTIRVTMVITDTHIFLMVLRVSELRKAL